jgi:manganese/zinc/iron transport system substrate-binding protein
VVVGLVVGALAACTGGSSTGQGSSQRPRVLASVTMLADSAAALLGDAAEVEALIGPGVDPHLYRATRDDMRRLLEADLVLTVGLHLEANLESAWERLAEPGKASSRLIPLGELVPAEILLSTPIGAEGNLISVDPHLWMDVSLWSQALTPLAAQLAARFPEHGAAIQARTSAYLEQLALLDGYIAGCMLSIPHEQRWLITAHDAFRYFGRRYGIEVRGLQGLSTESEAGLRELAELVELLVERRIPAVFVESSVPEQGVRALIAGAKERGHAVRLGGTLYSDATGPAGTATGTLIGMLVHNAETICLGLGGSLPPGGFAAWSAGVVQASKPVAPAQADPRSSSDHSGASAVAPGSHATSGQGTQGQGTQGQGTQGQGTQGQGTQGQGTQGQGTQGQGTQGQGTQGQGTQGQGTQGQGTQGQGTQGQGTLGKGNPQSSNAAVDGPRGQEVAA